jgi:hypothetical protein
MDFKLLDILVKSTVKYNILHQIFHHAQIVNTINYNEYKFYKI